MINPQYMFIFKFILACLILLLGLLILRLLLRLGRDKKEEEFNVPLQDINRKCAEEENSLEANKDE